MKTTIVAFTAIAFIPVVADVLPTNPTPTNHSAKVRHMTPEMREHLLRHMGDFVIKPGSQQGTIAFLNAQDMVEEKVVRAIPANYGRVTGYNMAYGKVAPKDPAALKAASKANLAIIAVWDEKTPSTLIALDDGWAVVNFAKLDVNLKSVEAKNKFFISRCQKALLRAFTILGGGAASTFKGDNIMNVATIEEFDLGKVFIPNDKLQLLKRELPKRGITPQIKAQYRIACKQGWAPQPTNAVQKAIWEDVHRPPEKPMKITYDKDRQKPVVK